MLFRRWTAGASSRSLITDVLFEWLDRELLAPPISATQWASFLEVMCELQPHDADGSLEWGVSFELNGTKCFATIDEHQFLTFVNFDHDRVRAVVDQTTKTMILELDAGDECVPFTVNLPGMFMRMNHS